MKRQYACEGCGATNDASSRGRLPRFCNGCLPAELRRRFREEWFPRYKAKDPDRDKARHWRWNHRRDVSP